MYRKPLFWIIFTLLVILTGIYCLTNMDRFMSFINLEITMSRQEALDKAMADSKKWEVGPDSCRQAVVFNQDSFLQYYVELEAGGKEQYNKFLAEGKYQPFQWVVRHFVPGEEHALYIYYTPDGELYGFVEVVPESQPGNNISVEDARIMGEKAATALGVTLPDFELIETKKNETISGRMDYTFVYERPELLKEARYRFRIEVSGDHVSALEYYMKTPEAFQRRFMEMRSANNTIASTSQNAMFFLYGLIGIGLGCFYLLRKRYLLYKKAVLAAFIVSFLGFISSFNQLPISWIWYDTAVTSHAHVMQQITMYLMMFVQDFFLLALSFITAESLTRLAFPDQVRFWKTLSAPVAGSKRILGNTIAGYGLVTFNLAYVMGFYLFTSNNMGWWNPASLQIDPNFIAMPLPWLSVLSQALHAGFWEEALFRAIPLAGMILIGRKLGKEKLFLVIGLILQALIFSAGHANYAAQPAYARVVELIVPSLLFAFLYLRFGLYTGVILHFSFDAVLMAMYIWIMKAPGIWLNRILVIIGILLPLIIVFYYRMRNRKWQEIAEPFLNKHWQPAPPKPPKVQEISQVKRSYNPKIITWLAITALAGVVLWILCTNFSADQPRMEISRKQAVNIAKDKLVEQGIDLGANWRIDASIINYTDMSDKLVWQSAGKAVYQKAMGQYIKEPRWDIRFRTFEGDVVERAESYSFQINQNGHIVSFGHNLPEDREGLQLSESEARSLAISALTDFYDLNVFDLDEVQAIPSQKPSRRDWQFVFRDTVNYQLPEGEYRYSTGVYGDKVMNISRYTYVPQEWERQERSKTRIISIFSSFANILMILIYVALGIMAVISWSNHNFDLKSFFFVLIIVLITSLALKLNNWQQVPAGFSTSEPWNHQVLQFVLGSVTMLILTGFTFALLAGFLGSWQNKVINRLRVHNAILSAFFLAGLTALITLLKPEYQPWRPALNFLGDFSPFIQVVMKAVSQWISTSLIFIFLVKWIAKITNNGHDKKFLTWLLFFVFIIISRINILVYAQFADFITLIAMATVIGLVLTFIFRYVLVFDLTILPVFLAVNASIPLLQNCLVNGWQQAVSSNITAIVLINLLGYFWMKILRKKATAIS